MELRASSRGCWGSAQKKKRAEAVPAQAGMISAAEVEPSAKSVLGAIVMTGGEAPRYDSPSFFSLIAQTRGCMYEWPRTATLPVLVW